MLHQVMLRSSAAAMLVAAGACAYVQHVPATEAGTLTRSIMSSKSPIVAPAALPQAQPTGTPTPRFGGGFGARDVVAGRLLSLTSKAIVIQGFAGKQTLTLSPLINYFQVVRETARALHVGESVTLIVLNTTAPATSITIAPPGGLYGTVVSFAGVRRPTGTPRPSGTPRAGFGPGARRGGRTISAGTVSALTSTSISVKLAQGGATRAFKLAASSAVYGFTQVDARAIKVGSTVSVTTATTGGHLVAIDVTYSSIPNTTGSLTATP